MNITSSVEHSDHREIGSSHSMNRNPYGVARFSGPSDLGVPRRDRLSLRSLSLAATLGFITQPLPGLRLFRHDS